MNMHTTTLTEKQRIKKECFNSIVKDKWDNKSLRVEVKEPPFAYYSGDLFDCAIEYIGTLRGKRILEIGCGNGEISVWLARNGVEIYGIDISDESITFAKKRSVENGTDAKTHFSVSPAEETEFTENFFDTVFINVSLHHLEIDKAVHEIKRILKPQGRFVAVEPFVFSKIVQRIRTSKLVTAFYPIRQETPTERILVQEDLDLLERNFSGLEYKPYRIFSPFIFKVKPLFFLLADIMYRNERDQETRRRMMNRAFQRLDEGIVRVAPFMRFLSRYIVLKAQNNKSA